jgi:hypothetical protein
MAGHGKKHPRGPSELVCSFRMREIELGRHPLSQDWYSAWDVAERYGVNVQSVYDGIREAHVLFPQSEVTGNGSRPRRRFSREAIEACDQRRLWFYKTTPSWHAKFVPGAPAAPPRRSAEVVIAEAKRRSGLE